MSKEQEKLEQKKSMSFMRIIGVIFLPTFFCWGVTKKKGFSTLAVTMVYGWTAIYSFVYISNKYFKEHPDDEITSVSKPLDSQAQSTSTVKNNRETELGKFNMEMQKWVLQEINKYQEFSNVMQEGVPSVETLKDLYTDLQKRCKALPENSITKKVYLRKNINEVLVTYCNNRLDTLALLRKFNLTNDQSYLKEAMPKILVARDTLNEIVPNEIQTLKLYQLKTENPEEFNKQVKRASASE
ncbi:MAG: hypothetical protein COW00_01250 [Bdellovibrio sp. CG12_big_fil_rev_8_21_14_0_65_39_13]|nr:MAG: hypothetical protein COW78_15740 [Bdellovibrio sp. CG22_combo_CG10-13_8_21_14_all_39_27]PIQ62669.1 MAG: hypothetical protein COW00_01250 [Bdellovibrio sp. CG12_big_fil_rev_8_21_14_0_65_39_13]PIR33553.1 MAG: hypothetical protein COV37_15950 [Bdellovibrio sp. CG11_big_fil_rev_8_21_14_0_20_39_38]